MTLIEKILGFRETKTKRFEYRFEPYMIIIFSGLAVWLILGVIGGALNYPKTWVIIERLVWWFAFIWTMFYLDRRNSKMALDHNLQQIDIRYNEMHNLRAFKTLTEELIKTKIELKKWKTKCSHSKDTKKTATKSTTTKKTSSAK